MAYSDKVIDHYENPRNVGTFKTETEVDASETSAPGSSARRRAATSCGSRSTSRTA